jgi:hypothetical protein
VKCVNCGAPDPADATRIAYVHILDGEVTGGREFVVCSKCARHCKAKSVALKMRAAYKAARLN